MGKRINMTFAEARSIVRAFGLTIRCGADGEYRVNFSGGSEATAYYTPWLDDAVDTARAMALQASAGAGGAPSLRGEAR